MLDMNKYFGEDSFLTTSLKNFEIRDEQIAMAKEVLKTIEESDCLVAEAGCGIGKSFAYLIPFILWCVSSEKNRVAVTTYTKTLQQQLVEKDLPLLKEALGVDFKAALCLGSENYLCLRRLDSSFEFNFAENNFEVKSLERIRRWADETADGLKISIDFKFSENSWSDVSRFPDLCKEKRCPHFSECFFYRAKKEQAAADILVLNHHLLFNDIASGRMIIPKYNAIVFDEAHNIEDSASDALGVSVSMIGVTFLINRIYKPDSTRSLLRRMGSYIEDGLIRDIAAAARNAMAGADNFFSEILAEFGRDSLTKRLRNPDSFPNTLSEPLAILGGLLEAAAESIDDEDASSEYRAFARRTLSTADDLTSILRMTLENYVYYLQIKQKRHRVYCSLNATPVEVAGLMKKLIFDEISPVILTSATLTVNNSFDFINRRLGIENPRTILLDSPYDFKKKALFYLPKNIPAPAQNSELFKESITEHISSLIEITGGRTAILFTSYSMLNSVAPELTNRFPEITFLVQGELSRKQIIQEFTRNSSSVLMGTSTFWQGVDFPGSILECVILTKLPFSVPDDPITEARIEALKKEGKNAFMEYQVPVAALMFKQGFGRLLRHRDDYGIIAALDPRLRTKRYGKNFTASLPECRNVNNISELKRLYSAFGD